MVAYTNIMELLVENEVEQQLSSLPSQLKAITDPKDLVTFALNRLPPLYARTAEGLEHQIKRGQSKFQPQIVQAVRMALVAVQQDPLRQRLVLESLQHRATRRQAFARLQKCLQGKTPAWETLAIALEQSLRRSNSLTAPTVPPAPLERTTPEKEQSKHLPAVKRLRKTHEQITRLKQGVATWNHWRAENPEIKPNFSGFDLNGVDLTSIDLSGADLIGTQLVGACLTAVNLNQAYLRNINLSEACLAQATLESAGLSQACLIRANLQQTVFKDAYLSGADLSGADLGAADLSAANLSEAKLSAATLFRANLSGANFCLTQVHRTNFKKATLSGACIQDWQITSDTKLEGVQCDFIYRKTEWNRQKHEYGFSQRLPADPESSFAPGEFVQRFQILASALETIDLTFTEGIDWQAFFASFQELREQHPDEAVVIQGMLRKGNAFIVQLEVEADADKGAIETEIKQRYHAQLELTEARYRAELAAKDREIEIYKQQGTDMMEITKLLAARDPTVNFHGPVGSAFNHGQQDNVAGQMDGDQHHG